MDEKRYALLIASSAFPDEPLLQDLRCPEADVDGLNDILTSETHGPYDEIHLLKNTPHYDVLRRINQVLRRAEKEDLVLIYYSGHGKLNIAGHLHLATVDTVVDTLESSSIPVNRIRELVEVSKANKVILMLDCCFSGAAGAAFTRSGADDQLRLASGGRGTYIMSASTGIQVALEKESEQYGTFTKHVIEGIRQGGADANSDGLIDMDELYRYVHDRVLEEGGQEPMKWDLNVRGQLFIARSGKTPREERRRQVRRVIIDLADQGVLPDGIVSKALETISLPADHISGVSQAYDSLLDELVHDRIPTGEFIERWYQLSSGDKVPPRISLTPESLNVATGDSVEMNITIENPEGMRREYDIIVEGIDNRWCRISTSNVLVQPRSRVEVSLAIQPPRSSTSKAGLYDGVVLVVLSSDHSVEARANFALGVQRFLQFDAEMNPRRDRGRIGRYRLRVTNTGNVPTTYSLSGNDPDELYRFKFEPSEQRIDPGANVDFKITVNPRNKPLFGKPIDYHFRVIVSSHASETGEQKSVEGLLECTPLLPKRTLWGGGALGAAIIIYLAVGVPFHWPPYPAPSVVVPTPTPTPSLIPTPTEPLGGTPQGGVTPTDLPEATATPTSQPTATPTSRPTATTTPKPTDTLEPYSARLLRTWGGWGRGKGEFDHPTDIAVAADGKVYVVESRNHRVQVFSSAGTFLSSWGTQGSGDGEFDCPMGIAIGGDNNVYVADSCNHRVQVFTSEGAFLSKWGSEGTDPGQFSLPRGIAVGPNGSVYVTDATRVQVFSSTGTFKGKWGSYIISGGEFWYPDSIAVDHSGRTYVVDLPPFGGRLLMFGSDGVFLGESETQPGPKGVAVDEKERVYVIGYASIEVFGKTDTALMQWGDRGSGGGEFLNARGIDVGVEGDVYVADTDNNRVLVFKIRLY